MTRRLFSTAFILILIATSSACRRIPDSESEATRPQPVLIPTPQPSRLPTGETHTTSGPLAVTVESPHDLRAVPLDAPFVLRFNQPMRTAGVDRPLHFLPIMRGEAVWEENGTVLRFVPDSHYIPDRPYVITLDSGVVSASGEAFETSQRWHIRTRAAPVVTHRTPARERLTERQPTIQVHFNLPMDASSVAAALHVEPALPLHLAWEAGTLLVTPEEPLAFNTTYTFTLTTEATSRSGESLSHGYNWTYRLAEIVQDVRSPSRANPDAPLLVRFNYAMDTARVTRAMTFSPPLEGTWSWDDEQTTATFTPAQQPPPDSTYTLTFNGTLRSAEGDALPVPQPLQFTTPVPIMVNTPTGDNVHPANHILVRFDRPVDRATAEAALQIEPALPGTFSWEETTLVVTPDDGIFQELTTYTVTVGTGLRSVDGLALLNAPYRWNFTTDELEDVATLGNGANAQIVDANGRRAIQYQAYSEGLTLDFELYRLTWEQFLTRYASGFSGVAGWASDQPPISIEGTAFLRRWRVESNDTLPSETTIPQDVPPGLYLLNLTTAGHLNAQLLLVLTANTLAVKQTEEQLVVWVTDINDGVAAGAGVEVYARSGDLLATGTADANGLYRTTLPPFEAGGPPSIEPLIVMARQGNDVTVSGLGREWRQGGYWIWWRPAPTAQDYTAYISTERPIYKPGQTVHFKAIVRQDEDAQLSLLPAGTSVTVRLRDGHDNVVQTQSLATNDFGSVHGSFALAEGAMLGVYHIELAVDGETHRQPFNVEDYRRPDYQVTVRTDSAQYVVGETIQITVEARYFFDEPVANADVIVNRFYLAREHEWSHDPGDYNWYESGDQPIHGRTDANGRFTTTVTANLKKEQDWGSNLVERRWAFEAVVKDGSNQSVSNFNVVHVYSASEVLELDTSGYLHEPGTPFPIVATVNTIAGEPVPGRSLTLQLRRYDSASRDYTQVVQSQSLTTGEDGRARISFTVEEPGYYNVYVFGLDSLDRFISYRAGLYAFDDANLTDWYGQPSALNITAAATTYAPGEMAELYIDSNLDGPALLTFERGTTRREQLIQLTPPLTVVEVPIQPDDVPNIYVTVSAWQEQVKTVSEETIRNLPDSRLHHATVMLSVPATDRTLNVTLTPDREVYAPRDEATFTVRVTNHAGTPVSAEVSLALVDDAIFALGEDLADPIYEGFYGERDNMVRTYNSLALTRLFLENSPDGGPSRLPTSRPRGALPETAAWFPTLTTDENGEVRVTVTLPDKLTTWRLTARAVTADTQVGEATTTILTR